MELIQRKDNSNVSLIRKTNLLPFFFSMEKGGIRTVKNKTGMREREGKKMWERGELYLTDVSPSLALLWLYSFL